MIRLLAVPLLAAMFAASGCATRKETVALRTRMVDLEARMTEQSTRSEDYLTRYQGIREQIESELRKAESSTAALERRMREMEDTAIARVAELNSVIQESAAARKPVEEAQARLISERVAAEIASQSAKNAQDLADLKTDVLEIRQATMLTDTPLGTDAPVKDVADVNKKVELMRTDLLKRIANVSKDSTSFRSVVEDRFESINHSLETLNQVVSEALKSASDKYEEQREASRRALEKLEPGMSSPAAEPSPTTEPPKR